MSDRKGSRYDAIDALTEDVEEITKEVSKLITTSNKRGREIIELRDSNNEIVVLLRDMRNLVSKEAMQRLHQQVSATAKAEIESLAQSVHKDMDFRLQSALKGQVTPAEVSDGLDELEALLQQRIAHLQQFLQQLQSQLASLREGIQVLPTEEKIHALLASLRNELQHAQVTEERVKELLAVEKASQVTEERLQELLAVEKASQVTEERLQELLAVEKASQVTEERVKELLAVEKASQVTEERVKELLVAEQAKMQELLTAERATQLTEEKVQELIDVRATDDRVRGLIAKLQEEVVELKETHPSDERVQELLESRVTEERVQELVTASEKRIQELVATRIEDALDGIPEGLSKEDVQELLAATPRGITEERVKELLAAQSTNLTEERILELLTPYLRKEEITNEHFMRQILDLALDTAMRQERDRAAQFYVSKETANAQYLLRDEFTAMKSILVTRNDLETLGKNELDELRAEQETMRRSAASREHLKMLRGEFEDVRNRCEVLEGKLENVSGTLTLKSEPVALDVNALTLLQQQVRELTALLPESKYFTVGTATVKYLKVGDSRFLLSSGFPLVTNETDFHLVGIELPEAQATINQSQKEYSITLTPDGHLIFHRNIEGAVVKRFMFWY